MNALNVLCAQLTRGLIAIAKFLLLILWYFGSVISISANFDSKFNGTVSVSLPI